MEPQRQNLNPKRYITNMAELSNYQCLICTQISLIMMRCKTCKKSLCNQCSIDQKTKQNKCPIRCTNGPLQLELIPEYIPLYSCPFSRDCGVVIKSIKEFQEHSRVCLNISESQKEEENKKWNFMCSKKHTLSMRLGSYQQLIKRQKCQTCHQYGIVRVQCRKCNEFYCHHCRPLPLYASKCPEGHKLVRRNVKTLSYRCDVCQVSPAILNLQLDDDFICNYGICGICLKNWPEFQHPVQYISNDRNYCELVGNKKISSAMPKQDYQKFKSEHKLKILKGQKFKKCSWCQKQVPCYKYCDKCDKYYCFLCKNFEIFQNLACEFDHKLQQTQLSNLQELLLTSKVCYCCNAQPSLKQPRSQQFYLDKTCGVILCRTCFITSYEDNFHIHYKDISLRVNTCIESPTHPLFFHPANRQLLGQCFKCKQKKTIKFNCSMCSTSKFYCCQCVPPPDFRKCYCERMLEGTEKVLNTCTMCCGQKHVFTCAPCAYSICQDCIKEKQKKTGVMNQVQPKPKKGI